MNIEPLFPYAGDHAIQSVAFALDWNIPLTTQDLLNIRALELNLNKSLPTVNEVKTLTINLESPQVQPTAGGELGGIHFSKYSPTGGVSRSLQISRDNCIAIINDYTRWATVWNDVQKWFTLITESVLKERPIVSASLQYTDVFNWRANPETMELKDILNVKSKFLPSNIFDTKSLWHAHHGYLEKIETPVEYLLLENINVGLVDNNGQHSISILTVHKANLTKPIWEQVALNNNLPPLMQSLHERNKLVLSDLLTAQVQEKIKLNTQAL